MNKRRCEICKYTDKHIMKNTNKFKLFFRCLRCRLSKNLKYYVYEQRH